MFTPRILRRRWVLAVIFGCSLLYFIISIYKQAQYSYGAVEDVDLPKPQIPVEAFRWQRASDEKEESVDSVGDTQGQIPVDEAVENNNKSSVFKTCRNSVQGQVFITDDRGYVCDRAHILVGGCCNTEEITTRRFICDTCQKNGCCSVYEHCVSCCLQPEKQPLLRRILGQAQNSFQNLFASITDHFELCLAKCRTSSQSVQHENSYRDPKAKFCYGEDLPDVQPNGT